jgi:hypothetical protein
MRRRPYVNFNTNAGRITNEDVTRITQLMNTPEMQRKAYSALILLKQVVNNDLELDALTMTIMEMKTGLISKSRPKMKYEDIPDMEA